MQVKNRRNLGKEVAGLCSHAPTGVKAPYPSSPNKHPSDRKAVSTDEPTVKHGCSAKSEHATALQSDKPQIFAKRELTRQEARRITKEVMALGLEHWEDRVQLAVIKAIEVAGGDINAQEA